jgi:hypothetical protein
LDDAEHAFKVSEFPAAQLPPPPEPRSRHPQCCQRSLSPVSPCPRVPSCKPLSLNFIDYQ